MARLAVFGIVLALGVSVTPMSYAQSLAARPAIEFSAAGDAFARSVGARYDGVSAAAVRADLRAQEFDCASDGTYCTRAVSDGPCTDAWTVDIEASGAVSGRHTVLCMGGEDE